MITWFIIIVWLTLAVLAYFFVRHIAKSVELSWTWGARLNCMLTALIWPIGVPIVILTTGYGSKFLNKPVKW